MLFESSSREIIPDFLARKNSDACRSSLRSAATFRVTDLSGIDPLASAWYRVLLRPLPFHYYAQ